MFKAKALEVAADLVKSILSAFLSSQEETVFGDVLEELSIFVCGQVYGGRKSSSEGIDLEFERDKIRYLVSIKSGPNWGNSSQINRMKDNFRRAKRVLRANTGSQNIVAINGCCYGKDRQPDKGDYSKLCGQRFWELISGDEGLYMDIIEPLGRDAKKRTARFAREYAKAANQFTHEFLEQYCDSSGAILWEKLVRFNSGK